MNIVFDGETLSVGNVVLSPSFRCEVCKRTRIDCLIDVLEISMGIEGTDFKTSRHVNYCNDNERCKDEARTIAATWRLQGGS